MKLITEVRTLHKEYQLGTNSGGRLSVCDGFILNFQAVDTMLWVLDGMYLKVCAANPLGRNILTKSTPSIFEGLNYGYFKTNHTFTCL